jgi:hypothetical protein
MDEEDFDELSRSLTSAPRRGLLAGLIGGLLVALPAWPGAEATASKKKNKRNNSKGKKRRQRRRKQRQLCRAACGGNCDFCRQRCAICPDPCPICEFEADGDRHCATEVPDTNCEHCSVSATCDVDFRNCLTGFTDLTSGTTQRFSQCGTYPDGVCASQPVRCLIPGG